MEELAKLEKLVLAKGRERLYRLVENGTMSQEEADAKYKQARARMRTGGLTHALTLGTPHPATMGSDVEGRHSTTAAATEMTGAC